MSRAGLTYFIIFTVCINLAGSAPLPGGIARNLAKRYNEYDNDFVTRNLAILNREFDGAEYKREYLYDVEFDVENDGYTKHEYDVLSIINEREVDGMLEPSYSKLCDASVHRVYRRSFWGKIGGGLKKVGSAIRHTFHKVKSGFQRAGGAIKGGLQRVRGTIKSGFQKARGVMRKSFKKLSAGFRKAGRAIRKGLHRVKASFQKASAAIKKGFQKASGVIKNAAKVTKFGLKVVAAAASVGSKMAKFVPGVGTAVGIALKGAALGANEVSNRIPVSLGGQLDKVSEGMDYVISPMGSLSKLAANAKGPGGSALAVAESLLL